ncbi:MAG: peptidase [Melioribacteraceae bacterium]|nr:MAG: peptidase [Melioribacteraceae bacterium]
MSRVILIFLDGVGLGEENPEKNPFFRYNFRFITDNFENVPSLTTQHLSTDDKEIFPVDANLDIDGLPQSGTGQVSLLCGMNASQFIGKHFGPFPYSLHQDTMKRENLFKAVKDMGLKSEFVNAYPQIFFDYLNKQKKRIGAFALSALFSDIKLKTQTDLENGEALSNDITNERWRTRLNLDIRLVQPEIAAERLLKISSVNDFTVFEYFLTDHIGHGRIKENLDTIYSELDAFLSSLLLQQDDETDILIISDHGNFEDISVKTHTRNPVFSMASGPNSGKLSHKINSLIDVKRTILELLKN